MIEACRGEASPADLMVEAEHTQRERRLVWRSNKTYE